MLGCVKWLAVFLVAFLCMGFALSAQASPLLSGDVITLESQALSGTASDGVLRYDTAFRSAGTVVEKSITIAKLPIAYLGHERPHAIAATGGAVVRAGRNARSAWIAWRPLRGRFGGCSGGRCG